MIPFAEFNARLQKHVAAMVKDETVLFEMNVDNQTFWEHYLDSFPAGTNEKLRERRYFDCNCCRRFVYAFGNVVAIKNTKITSIWDFDAGDADMQVVVDSMSKYVKNRAVQNVFLTDVTSFGEAASSREMINGKVHEWNHFNCKIPDKFKFSGIVGSQLSNYQVVRDVFERSVKEISEDAILTVLDLINANNFYRGSEWKGALEVFLKAHREYAKSKAKDAYLWETSVRLGPAIGKIRNHSIGKLLTDITEGGDLEKAVKFYEKMVAPDNYKRPMEIFTKKQIEEAQKLFEAEGLAPSLPRRSATLDDIKVNDCIFTDRMVSRMKGDGNPFDEMKSDLGVTPKNFGRVEEITIDKFLADVVPTATSMELYLANAHESNLVTLIAPVNKDSKSLFKWDNGFSWAYHGNVADAMKERVKTAGGNIEGVLRFSISWNESGKDNLDLDAHAFLPDATRIYYGEYRKPSHHPTSGCIDIDITQPKIQTPDGVAVENIVWTDIKKMIEGEYRFRVHNFSTVQCKNGFKAQIEMNGEVFDFNYPKPIMGRDWVDVAVVSYSKRDGFEIKPVIEHTQTPKEMWGLKSMQFHPVQVVMFSPNHWENEPKIGNQHIFFMLKGAKCNETPNGFMNEFLREDFMKHKRVMAAMGSKMKVDPSEDQLSGVGFSTTLRSEVVVKVGGRVNRTFKVKF